MSDFQLHEILARDTVAFDDWTLNRVLVMNDANYPWVVLVPRRTGLTDLHDLDRDDWGAMATEIVRVSQALKAQFDPIKINVAALGNQVPQLHVHVIARRADDPAWPKPVWGAVPAKSYDDAGLDAVFTKLREAFLRA